jgi:hypothetical protein
LQIIAPREDADIAVRVVFCRQQAADWSHWDADNALMRSAVQKALKKGLPVHLLAPHEADTHSQM